MAISRELIESHVAEWGRRLRGTSWPYRHFWPRRLFRHEPVQNAAQILRSGFLRSRRDVASEGIERIDIAAPSVIATRDDAHESVRLYFRPRNPTQYWIEGVRKSEECVGQELQRQAAMLAMLVFDASELLIRSGVRFSNGNMQASAGRTQVGDDEDFFCSINFELVYHEGPFDPQSPHGWDITRSRCAEVLIPSPLELQGSLRAVVCRSPAERATLLHLAGDRADLWASRILVEPMPGFFFREKAFVESVAADSEGLTVTFNPRRDGRLIQVSLELRREGRVVFQSRSENLDPSHRWRWPCALAPGIYLCSIELEGILAHEAPFLIDDLPF